MFVKLSLLILMTCWFAFLSGCTVAPKTETPKPEQKSIVITPVQLPQAAKPVPAPQPDGRITCKVDDDERAIQIVKAAEKKEPTTGRVCEVVYTKASKAEVVAGSNLNLSHCEEVKKRIQSNLETGGFKCN